ncbi:MAG: iron ABC transporter permease [Bacilli bacterium]|nr:iron ABC transporter permease [Bacilli bacterium]
MNPQSNGKLSKAFTTVSTWLARPENVILLILGLVLSFTVLYPLWSVIQNSLTVHAGKEARIAQSLGYGTEGLQIANWHYLLTGPYGKKYLWEPLGNSLLLATLSCFFALLFGGVAAFLVTRTNMPCKKWISTVFIFPYIMPQWTLALVWKNLFWSAKVTGGSNGLLAFISNGAITMPEWWCRGIFPCAMVLGMHYAAFAYILIGGIFKNMDASLEEAATILNTPKWKIITRITIPMIVPAILSTILLVFSSAVGSYPVVHYIGGKNFSVLATSYIDLRAITGDGYAAIIGIVMLFIGFLILIVNQVMMHSRKQFITVSGKSAQATKINLGKVFKWVCAIALIIATLLTSLLPIFSFALETFVNNPGDYSSFTLKWWIYHENGEVGMYGNYGVFFNKSLWLSFRNQAIVAISCALVAGTIGFLTGYAVSRKRKSKFASYVNGMSFFPYLIPAVAFSVAYYAFGLQVGLGGFMGTMILMIICGSVKYIPFSSRSSLSAMMQLSPEIEEAAVIQGAPWWKRMGRIVIPIQKSAIISGYLLPFITGMRELNLFMFLVNTNDQLATTSLAYYDEMGLTPFSSAVNLIIIIFVLVANLAVNLLTGASIDSGIGGGKKNA